jgi:uncharacterized protein YodC (DUF2158 family)
MTKEAFQALQVGDTVRLKSGSPALLVEKIEGDIVHCILWDEAKLQVSSAGAVNYIFLLAEPPAQTGPAKDIA